MTRHRPAPTEVATVSGVYVDILSPDPASINIEDIAHALAHQARFNGHLPQFYSVAAHSVLVSHLIDPDLALAGLLHDAAEAYLGDIVSPLKRLLPDYLEHERVMMTAICKALPVDPSTFADSRVKAADLWALALEQKHLSSVPADDWGLADCLKFKLSEKNAWPTFDALHCTAPAASKDMFLARFAELTPQK